MGLGEKSCELDWKGVEGRFETLTTVPRMAGREGVDDPRLLVRREGNELKVGAEICSPTTVNIKRSRDAVERRIICE